MEPSYKEITEANRASWNEAMPHHQAVRREKLDQSFMQPGFSTLDENELVQLRRIGVKGKAVAHLMCNNGIELLSIKNQGAGACTGFDISDAAIQEAQERAAMTGIDCQYVRADVYEIAAQYENRFDLVYISIGGLTWLPDLKLFFSRAAALLKANGQIFIYDMHPFAEMLSQDDCKETDVLQIVYPYFKGEPYVEYGSLDYVGGQTYNSPQARYSFVHKVSDILMGLIENRITIEHFSEYEMDISAQHHRVENAGVGIPLSYILIGRKA